MLDSSVSDTSSEWSSVNFPSSRALPQTPLHSFYVRLVRRKVSWVHTAQRLWTPRPHAGWMSPWQGQFCNMNMLQMAKYDHKSTGLTTKRSLLVSTADISLQWGGVQGKDLGVQASSPQMPHDRKLLVASVQAFGQCVNQNPRRKSQTQLWVRPCRSKTLLSLELPSLITGPLFSLKEL